MCYIVELEKHSDYSVYIGFNSHCFNAKNAKPFATKKEAQAELDAYRCRWKWENGKNNAFANAVILEA